jgi:hypothetical protein
MRHYNIRYILQCFFSIALITSFVVWYTKQSISSTHTTFNDLIHVGNFGTIHEHVSNLVNDVEQSKTSLQTKQYYTSSSVNDPNLRGSSSSVDSKNITNTIISSHRNQQASVVQIRGELRMWHKVTLAITGPYSYELNGPDGVNPFTDYNVMVRFVHTATNKVYTVPGYFAADGNAAETSAKEGTQWFVHFAPDQTGIWTYTVDFKKGRNIATQTNQISTNVTPAHGFQGVINIQPTDKTGRDHRGKGRLIYSSKKHHYQFAQTGEYFLKAGTDRYVQTSLLLH